MLPRHPSELQFRVYQKTGKRMKRTQKTLLIIDTYKNCPLVF